METAFKYYLKSKHPFNIVKFITDKKINNPELIIEECKALIGFDSGLENEKSKFCRFDNWKKSEILQLLVRLSQENEPSLFVS